MRARLRIDTGGILKLSLDEGCRGGLLLSDDQGYLSDSSSGVRAQQTGEPVCGDVDRSPAVDAFLKSEDVVSAECASESLSRRLLALSAGGIYGLKVTPPSGDFLLRI